MQYPGSATTQLPYLSQIDIGISAITQYGIGQQWIKRHKEPIGQGIAGIVRQQTKTTTQACYLCYYRHLPQPLDSATHRIGVTRVCVTNLLGQFAQAAFDDQDILLVGNPTQLK
ncbi:hypothetical protein AO718_06980 [Aeromonas veronii]|nr:hypothetical protein AO718_06980 [Aeromonas veronii]KRW01677.1 hypothetical protein AO725_16415 [Aeromonas veronii]KRW11066.1 hypothetical protein AO745_15895 [Aeromonas veronii]KRW12764.1 hypothetical protein AO732_18660 [Aeromonas veronii]KRW20829.1 hypothetical protein AO734_18400 [Aeromonas veronii]